MIFAIMVSGMTAGIASAFGDEAVGWVGDLPVPAHALIETDDAVNFDSPAGRVVAFTIQTRFDALSLAAFYESALVPIGWVKGAAGYERGREVMMIAPAETGDELPFAYRITVKPALE